ncbi:MAG: Dabb family protein [Arcicella sp.]|nr:Dabb family protein [Arcicella sp.]
MENSSRREFLEKSTAALVAGTVMTTFTSSETEAHNKEKTSLSFIHHVFFWLKNPKNKQDHDKLLAGLKGLGKIKEIKMAHIGLPSINDFDKSVTDASYSFSVLLVFNNKADEEKYLVNPLHKKFIDDHKDLWSKVVVYDSAAIL